MKYEFNVGGEEYEFDDSHLSVAEALLVKEKTGLGVIQWGQGINAGDPHSLMALVLLAKKRAGEAAKWDQLQDLNIMDLVMQVMRSMQRAFDEFDRQQAEGERDPDEDDGGGEAEPDPTPPPAKKKPTRGRTQKSA